MSTSAKRLRVLVVPQQVPHGPNDLGGIFSLDYIAAIRPHCDVTVLATTPSGGKGFGSHVDGDGVKYVTFTPRLGAWGTRRRHLERLESVYALARIDRALLPTVDLVHAHGPVINGAPASSLARRLGVPLVVSVHTGPFAKLLSGRAMRHLTRRTLERADCVCPVSHDLRRQITASGIRMRRVEVTYNPVDTDLFRPSAFRPQRAKRIAFAGRLEEYKGGLRSVQAFAQVAERWPEWSLAVAGDGPELSAIERFVQSRPGLVSRVQLVGFQTKAQLADLFADSEFLVYPSRHETFGLVLAEAMSAGLPVIGPDRTAPPEFIDDRGGVLVPPDDVDAIAAAMERVLQSLHAFDRAGIREAVVRRFGLAAFGERLVRLYEDLHDTALSGASPCAA